MVREERGIYRAVHSVLIDSHEFTDLSDDAKLVFYTLRFCPENNLASIFSPFYLEILHHRVKMGPDRLSIAIRELIDSHWIVYQMPILWIRNGLKFSPGVSLANEKHLTAIFKILKGLPKLKIVAEFCEYYKLKCPLSGPLSDRLFNSLSDSLSIAYSIQKEEEDKGRGKRKGKGKGKGVGEGVQGENLGSSMNGFQAFWERYPKKEGRDKAEESWLKKAKKVPIEVILQGLEKWERSQKWADGFIPMPATWLNQGRWKDDPEQYGGTELPGVGAALRVAEDIRKGQTGDR